MLLIAVSYGRCGRNLQAKLDTVINSLSANRAYRKMVYTSVREYVFYVYFSDFKKHDFLRFFEMTYQKVVKSL